MLHLKGRGFPGALVAQPLGDKPGRSAVVQSCHGGMRVEGAQVHGESEREQAVIDLLAQLKKVGMCVADARPEYQGLSPWREGAHPGQRQKKRRDPDLRQRSDELGDPCLIEIAEEAQREMQLGRRCPYDVARRQIVRCREGRTDGGG